MIMLNIKFKFTYYLKDTKYSQYLKIVNQLRPGAPIRLIYFFDSFPKVGVSNLHCLIEKSIEKLIFENFNSIKFFGKITFK